MNFGRGIRRGILGAIAGGLGLGAVAAQAAPLPVGAADAPASRQTVQFYYYDDEPPPPVYYDPPRYYAPPPRAYRAPPPPPAYYPPPRYGYYGKDEAKEDMKNYRRTQKEIAKDQIRSWNKRNGF